MLLSQRRKPVVSIRTQAVKLHENFDHFSIVCWSTKEKHLRWIVRETFYTSTE